VLVVTTPCCGLGWGHRELQTPDVAGKAAGIVAIDCLVRDRRHAIARYAPQIAETAVLQDQVRVGISAVRRISGSVGGT